MFPGKIAKVVDVTLNEGFLNVSPVFVNFHVYTYAKNWLFDGLA